MGRESKHETRARIVEPLSLWVGACLERTANTRQNLEVIEELEAAIPVGRRIVKPKVDGVGGHNERTVTRSLSLFVKWLKEPETG